MSLTQEKVPGCLTVQSLSQWKQEKNHETCSQADYYADQQSLSFLSLPQMLSAICW